MPMIDPARARRMEELADELDATVDKLDAALARQNELAAQVHDIRRRNHWLIAGISVAFLIAAGAVVVGLKSLDISAQQEQDRLAVTEATCLVRNGGTLRSDLRFAAVFDFFEARSSDPSVIDELRNVGVGPVDERFADCDGDGVVGDAGDFPDELAQYAPDPN